MTAEQFTAWLTQWLSRHPTKSPSDAAGTSYTQDVMARIAAASQQPAPARWTAWQPGWVLAFGGAVAAVMLVIVLSHRSTQLARQNESSEIPQLARVLLDAGEDPSEVALEVADPEEVANELIAMDRLMLAEAPPSTDFSQAIWQEMDLLNQLDDDTSDVDSESDKNGSDEDLLHELELMDHASSA